MQRDGQTDRQHGSFYKKKDSMTALKLHKNTANFTKSYLFSRVYNEFSLVFSSFFNIIQWCPDFFNTIHSTCVQVWTCKLSTLNFTRFTAGIMLIKYTFILRKYCWNNILYDGKNALKVQVNETRKCPELIGDNVTVNILRNISCHTFYSNYSSDRLLGRIHILCSL